jgi:hypothetical protein
VAAAKKMVAGAEREEVGKEVDEEEGDDRPDRHLVVAAGDHHRQHAGVAVSARLHRRVRASVRRHREPSTVIMLVVVALGGTGGPRAY